MIIGYGNGNLETDVEMGETNYPIYLRQAIQFPASDLQALKGNKVTHVLIPLAMNPSDQENEIFLSHDLSQAPFYTQQVDKLSEGWNDITLDTPYEITGDKDLYIGLSFKSKGMIISFDGEKDASDYANWMAFSQLDGDYTKWSWYHETGGNLNLKAIIEGDNLPQNAASVTSLHVGKCQPTGQPVSVDLIVRNMGAEAINSLSISCTFKGATSNFQIDGLNIPSNGYKLISIDNFAVESNGIGTLTVGIDMVNGNENENASHQTESGNLIFNGDYAKRYILLEQFSSQICANCPTGHATIARNVEKYSNVIWVTHHCGFANDSFTIPESAEYLKLFDGQEGTFNPAMMVNRTNLSQYGGESSTSPVVGPDRDSAPTIFEGINDAPAYLALDITPAYDSQSRELSVTVDAAIPSGNTNRISGDNVNLFIFLVEDSLIARQLNNRSEYIENYIHNNVIRHIMTATWGDDVTFDTDGNFHSTTYTYTLPETWNEKNMRVVAFIANSDSGTPNNNTVYNSTQSPLMEDTSGIEDVNKADESKITITGNTIYSPYCGTVEIYNTAGTLIARSANCTEFDISNLSHGVYIVRIYSATETYTQKFIH